jgi:hypothetical protein
MVDPQGHYGQLACDGILVLQRGENASTDYYLRPRLEHAGVPFVIADLASSPEGCPLLASGGPRRLMAIVCRYGAESWLEALRSRHNRLSRVAFFMDDDLPAMMRDPGLPRSVRGKVALHFGDHVASLSHLASEVWVSSPILAERYPEAGPAVLAPLPEADPPEPLRELAPKVVYHGTDVHPRERAFVVEIARRLSAQDISFEIGGDAALARLAAGLPRVSVVPQRPWPEFLLSQAGATAAVSLAPLFASVVNAARAPVKAFDAARLGAAGLFADTPPYAGFVRPGEDGELLPMEPQAWADAITALLGDPARRLRLALSARTRLIELRRTGLSFPAPPGE